MDTSIDRDAQQQGPACALSENELTDRLRAWRDLDARARLRQNARPERVTTFYRRNPDVTAQLEQLVALESQCCADLLRFDLSYHGDEAVLEVTAGPRLDQDVDELIASATVHGTSATKLHRNHQAAQTGDRTGARETEGETPCK